MNNRILSATMISMLLGVPAFALPGAEREAEAETADAGVSTTMPSPAPLLGSLDFRRPLITDGAFDPPAGGAFKALGIGMFVVAGADLASTELGLARPGVYETNPVQGNRNVRILTHVAAPVFMYWVTDKLNDQGKTKAALLVRIGFNVAYSYVVMHNLRTASSVSP